MTRVLVHDDGPPCAGTPLVDGRCPACGIYPDTQSTAIVETSASIRDLAALPCNRRRHQLPVRLRGVVRQDVHVRSSPRYLQPHDAVCDDVDCRMRAPAGDRP